MARWSYDTEHPPPQAFEAALGAVALITSANRISGASALGSNSQIYADEEPVEKPANERWVLVSEWQEAGGRAVSVDGLLRVKLHVKVVSPLRLENPRPWHAQMHAEIARSLVGQVPTLARSAPDENGFRQLTEPSRPEYYDDTKTRESFALYEITLQPLLPTP